MLLRGGRAWTTTLERRFVSKLSFKDVKTQTKHLIDLASKGTVSGTPDPAWKESINTEAYSNALLQHSNAKDNFKKHIGDLGYLPPSQDNLVFRDEQKMTDDSMSQAEVFCIADEDGLDVRRFYEPGSYIQTAKRGVFVQGVCLRESYSQTFKAWYVQMLSTTGEIFQVTKDDIAFTAPNFISSDLAYRCGMESLASNPVEHGARVKTLKELRKFTHYLEEAQGLFNPDRVDLYTTFRHSDPEKWGSVTLSEVIALVKPKRKMPDVVTVVATHRKLLHSPLHFMLDPDFRLNETFRVRPQAVIDRYHQVREWLSTKTVAPEFGKKAQRLLENYAKASKEHLGSRPSMTFYNSKQRITWTEDDKVIMRFLLDSAFSPYRNSMQSSLAIQNTMSQLNRLIFNDIPLVDEHSLDDLLRGIGAMAPWEDYFVRQTEQKLDFDEGKVKELVEAAIKSASVAPPPATQNTTTTTTPAKAKAGQVLGPEDLIPTDPLDGIRHDFGDLPVYIVDDENARELDDGFSIERVHNDPNSLWVHVHIADPASVIHPNHLFALEARKRCETKYFRTSVIPLLPESFMNSGLAGLSLQDQKDMHGLDKSQRVLSFSVRVNDAGDFMEYKVRGGIVRNAKRFTYDSIDRAMGLPMIKHRYPLGIPPEAQPALLRAKTDVAQLTPGGKQDWKDLAKVKKWLVDRKYRDGVWAGSADVGETKVIGPTGDMTMPLWNTNHKDSHRPQVFTGLPPLMFCSNTFADQDSGTRQVVAEMMKVASRLGSLFCRDHNAPIVRRGASKPTVASDSTWQELLDLRDSSCYVAQQETLTRVLVPPSAGYSTDLVGHFLLGIREGEGYVRSTSPLRRYMDLVTHWQIQSVLAHGKPMFDLQWMEWYAQEAELGYRTSKRAMGLETMYWDLLCVKDWIAKNSASDPSWRGVWDGVIVSMPLPRGRSNLYFYSVAIPDLGLKFVADDARAHVGDLKIGDRGKYTPDVIRFGTKPMLTVVPAGMD